jgi:pimeloyl-ACP methyl ester carboxylesterase
MAWLPSDEKRGMVAMPTISKTLIAAAILLTFISHALADEPSAATTPVKKLILPGESFQVQGRPAFVLLPPEEKRQKPQPWVFYAPTLPGFPDEAEKWMHEQFLAAGIAVAGIDCGEAYGSPAGVKLFTALYDELVEKRGFSGRPCLLGRSRGGLWVSSWAIANPDKVAGIAGIYPVFDLTTYPGLAQAASAYGMTAKQLEAKLPQHNPIARIDVLAKAKVPVFIIHGDDDKVVPLKQNSAELAKRYKAANAGDAVELVVANGQGHNYWEGFFRCQKLIAFAIARAKDGVVGFKINEDDDRIRIHGPAFEASIRKKDYVTGIEAQSLLDRKTGFREQGFGLDIVDWIMEPGSDEAYRDKLAGDLPYQFNNSYHGKRAKRSIEGPQICTKAGRLAPRLIKGQDFVAVQQDYSYHLAAPGKKTGSRWEQTIVFPAGKRYFLSSDKVTTVNASSAMFLRLDMPGHIKHTGGDTFSEVYLSYHGRIPAREFTQDFAPDERFLYVREEGKTPKRMIRAYRIRDPKTGKDGPWLAGMTLDPTDVCEAWCHQRGYVCMIEEIGGRPIEPGEAFGAAFIVGFFDSIDEMNEVYDQFSGHNHLEVAPDGSGWKLVKRR